MEIFLFLLCALLTATHAVLGQVKTELLTPAGRRLAILCTLLAFLVVNHVLFGDRLPPEIRHIRFLLATLMLASALGLNGIIWFSRENPAPLESRLFACVFLPFAFLSWMPALVFPLLGGFFLLLSILSFRFRPLPPETGRRSRRIIWTLVLSIILLLTSLGVARSQSLRETDLRNDLLMQARMVASTISRKDISRLNFDETDAHNPVFQRMSRQLALFADKMNHRAIYTMLKKDGNILFGPESLAPSDPMASPPGTVYEKPARELRQAFIQQTPFTGGPYRDEYGTYVSAFVPVLDRHSRKLLMVVGLDMETPTWNQHLRRARQLPLFFGMLSLLLVLAVHLSLDRRKKGRMEHFWLRHTHAAFFFLTGTLVASYIGMSAHTSEMISRKRTFQQLAISKTARIQESLTSLRDKELRALARFFESSEEVTSGEFRRFTLDFHQLTYVWTWAWAPRVEREELALFTQEVRNRTHADFAVFQTGENPSGDLYPILFIEPQKPNKVQLGMDLLADPLTAPLIEDSLVTGQALISDPVPLILETGSVPGAVIIMPVHLGESREKPSGFVMATLEFPDFLRNTVHWMDPLSAREHAIFSVDLMQMDDLPFSGNPAGNHIFLSSTRPAGHAENQGELVTHVPLFIMGKPYVAGFFPNHHFREIYPVRAGWIMFLAGMILVLCLTLLLGFIMQRHLELQMEVDHHSLNLNRSEEKYHQLVDNAPVGILVLYRSRILYANPAARNLLCLAGDQDWPDFCHFIHPEVRESFCKYIEVPGEQGLPFTIETDLSVGEKHIPCELQVSRFSVDSPSAFLVFMHDLTIQRSTQSENEKLLNRLNQSQKIELVGRLAGSVAHDFNNMLGVILGSTVLLLEQTEKSDPKLREVLEIQAAASRCEDLTRRLLAFARRQEVQPVIVDINQNIRLLKMKLKDLLGSGIHLDLQLAETVWLVRIDPEQIGAILTNLLTNAKTAMENDGTITIRTGNTVRAPAENLPSSEFVFLSVTDTGSGMAPGILSHVFEPFFSTWKTGEGTGLGLSMVHGMVTQNGGFIEVSTQPGVGSTFVLHFPRSESRRIHGPVSQPVHAVSVLGTETILLLEEEPANRRITQRMLERAGYEVIPAANAGEALPLFQNNETVIDLIMTEPPRQESDREALEEWAALFPGVHFLVMSDTDPENRTEETSIAPVFLRKPFTGKQLLELVHVALHGQGTDGFDKVET